ncbi:HTH_48 domain-containing protein [Trichonephila inaurata madagascariensis]|uniref:HTH_48 domain-containing protein n=1 Tax=Trichonephila inaurata madagascariensis TaxID=2747483 RepID=A0A8X6XBG5_9ARAC|nr:HTH_48 domain-containing protein [Trichonephila inaurata madagascariensis]
MRRSGVFEWNKLFREGTERVEYDERYGSPSTSKTNQSVSRVKNVLTSNRKMSIRTIADELSIVRVHPVIDNNWRQYHGNTSSQAAFRVVKNLAQHNVTTLLHPPKAPT